MHVAMTRPTALWRVAVLTLALGQPALAQNFGSTGQSWSGTWGFSSPSERALGLQTAQAILAARQGPTAPVYNTYNDNRSSYQELNSFGSSALTTGGFHIGDDIGQNTNSIGSMNTGTTNIDIDGSSNSIVATHGADNTGCVDGSIGLNTLNPITPTSTSGIDISIAGIGGGDRCR